MYLFIKRFISCTYLLKGLFHVLIYKKVYFMYLFIKRFILCTYLLKGLIYVLI